MKGHEEGTSYSSRRWGGPSPVAWPPRRRNVWGWHRPWPRAIAPGSLSLAATTGRRSLMPRGGTARVATAASLVQPFIQSGATAWGSPRQGCPSSGTPSGAIAAPGRTWATGSPSPSSHFRRPTARPTSWLTAPAIVQRPSSHVLRRGARGAPVSPPPCPPRKRRGPMRTRPRGSRGGRTRAIPCWRPPLAVGPTAGDGVPQLNAVPRHSGAWTHPGSSRARPTPRPVSSAAARPGPGPPGTRHRTGPGGSPSARRAAVVARRSVGAALPPTHSTSTGYRPRPCWRGIKASRVGNAAGGS